MPPPPGSVSFTPAGNSCSDGCGITYPTTTTVTIQATTSPTMTFSGWDGACSSSGSNPTCTIEVGKPVLVNSSFSYNSSGTVSSQPRTTVTGQQFQATYRMNSIIVEQNGYGSSYSPTSGRISMDSSLGTSCFGYNRPDFSCNFTSPVAGTVVITGTYAGSRNFGPSTTVFTHTVTRADTALTITGATPAPSVTGQPIAVNYNLYAVYPGGGTPMGSITISSSDGASATCPVTSSTGSCSVAPLRTGTVTLTARYNGDANYNASQATTTSVVTKADTTTTISVTPSGFSEPYQPVTITATTVGKAPSTSIADGSITITNNLGDTCSLASGTSCVITPADFTALVFTASYPGSADYNASQASISHIVGRVGSTPGYASITGGLAEPSVVGQRVRSPTPLPPRSRLIRLARSRCSMAKATAASVPLLLEVASFPLPASALKACVPITVAAPQSTPPPRPLPLTPSARPM